VSSCVIPYWLGGKLMQNACLRCGKKPGVIPCHPCAISKQNWWFCSMKYVYCHPVSSHVILGHFLSKMVYFCSEVSLVSSCVIPCHPWAFPIQNGVFLHWSESSVILCHPMSSLGNHIPNFMFFAGHMVKCHPMSSHIDLQAISMKNACLRGGKQPGVIPSHRCAISKQNSWVFSIKYVNCHPVSSHVILGHFLSKMVYFCNEVCLVSSCVIPCHPWETIS
jgi:hypothetical protein